MPGSHVIPMKTPLTRELQMGYLPRDPDTPVKHFTLASFLDDQRQLGRRVGLLVDLSNHQCLYSEDIKPDFHLAYRHFQFVAKRLPDPASCRKVGGAGFYHTRMSGHALIPYMVEIQRIQYGQRWQRPAVFIPNGGVDPHGWCTHPRALDLRPSVWKAFAGTDATGAWIRHFFTPFPIDESPLAF